MADGLGHQNPRVLPDSPRSLSTSSKAKSIYQNMCTGFVDRGHEFRSNNLLEIYNALRSNMEERTNSSDVGGDSVPV